MSDLAFLSPLEQAELVRRGEVSPVELTEMYLQRIEAHDAELGSFVTVATDQAMEAARGAEAALGDRDSELPPFHGVPISLKDLQETAGIRTTLSTKALATYVPDADEHVTRRIREAGFVILGKTNTPEFGSVPVTESELNGVCRNPWDTGKTPGGSSGGAAAALAAGLCPLSQGGDGGGSIRIPASCCGLFGIKPSRGRVSAGPRLGEHWHGFATSGPISRTVADAAALLDVMSGYETGDPYWAPPPERPFLEEVGGDPGRLRIAFTATSPNEVPVDPVVVAAMMDAARLLESLGHEVEEAAPDWVDPGLAPAFVQLISSGMAPLSFLDPELFEPLNRYLLEEGRRMTSIEHMQALMQAHAFARRVLAFWDDHDLVLTPTLALPPLPIGWIFQEDDPAMHLIRSGLFIPFTPVANVTGQPAGLAPAPLERRGPSHRGAADRSAGRRIPPLPRLGPARRGPTLEGPSPAGLLRPCSRLKVKVPSWSRHPRFGFDNVGGSDGRGSGAGDRGPARGAAHLRPRRGVRRASQRRRPLDLLRSGA